MAEEVTKAFQNSSLAIIEAGTGTGKTLAYLLPALLSGKKTIISTGLLNLQEQIFHKDLPFIREYFGGDFQVALLKGRSNYLCLRKMDAIQRKKVNLFTSPQDKEAFNDLVEWSYVSATGDKSEIESQIRSFIKWENLSSSTDDCVGQNCRHFKQCFSLKARKNAQNADLVLINHSLFMSDISLRDEELGQILPDWMAAVIDEAHLLESVATKHFGYSTSNVELMNLSREIVKAAEIWPALERFEDEIHAFSFHCDQLETFFEPFDSEIDLYREDQVWNEKFAGFLSLLKRQARSIADMVVNADMAQTETDDLGVLANRLERVARIVGFIGDHDQSEFVYQADGGGKRVTIQALPMNVAPYLANHLTKIEKTVILTSATLSANGSFRYFQNGLGVDENVPCLSLDSTYDYQGRTLLYIPKHLPAPDEGSKAFSLGIISEIEKVVNLSQGRALVLFTSYFQMKQAYEALNGRLPWRLLLQNQFSRSRLLAEFSKDIHSVLLATSSFWQGVDVPGESLTTVIIDKLPFPRPDRPLIKARSSLLKKNGGNPFKEYSLPETTLTLKQGLGRLMRHEADQGLMVILDNRIWTRYYGRSILKSLPPSPVTSNLADVAKFFAAEPTRGLGGERSAEIF
ncbi:MAG: ATP-dependent DNA helicase [Deltaproteobacteria bacterium]|nr:ATP-dependent DNA helicase [Deltaproteobacteria bacterium]